MAEPHRAPHAPQRPNFSKKRSVPTPVLIIGFVLVAGLAYIAGAVNAGNYLWGGGLGHLVGAHQLDTSSLQQTYDALRTNFDGEIDTNKLIEGANKGMVDSLGDQYTVYMNAKESTQFDNNLTGNIGGGIGIEVGMRNEVPTVVRVLKDNPAEKAGVAVGDIITKVNDDATTGKTLDEVVGKIRGEEGTSVKITVTRSGSEKTFAITRDKVNNPSAYGEVKGKTGIMTISRFDDQTGSLARAVAQEFKARGVKSIVLDLRGNGGGYVTAAQSVAGIWLDRQLVVTEKTGNVVADELKSTGSPILAGMPTVILVNESSASASEIVAGALRDHKVATLVGVTTFGKGSVQKLMDLSGGATLKVTIARWYTPAGVNISEKGITPDQRVDRTIEDINANRDPQLEAALKAVQ